MSEQKIPRPIIFKSKSALRNPRWGCWTFKPFATQQPVGFGWSPMEAYLDWLKCYKAQNRKRKYRFSTFGFSEWFMPK